MISPTSPSNSIEWTLPNVLPGICQIFLHVDPQAEDGQGFSTKWQQVWVDDTPLSLYRVEMGLATRQPGRASLEAIFYEEPTLDQMDSLLDFALRLEQRGLPAFIAGRF